MNAQEPQLPLSISMTCCGLGPAFSALFTNPLEVIKTRLQFSNEGTRLYRGPIDCARQTYAAEGIRGLQAGVGPAVLREGSKQFFRYGLYDPILKSIPKDNNSSHSLLSKVIAGCLSGAISAIACNPLDLIKTQLHADGKAGARSYGHGGSGLAAARSIVQGESKGDFSLRRLWVGTGVSVPRSMLSTSIMLPTQTSLKEWLLLNDGEWNGWNVDATSATLLSSLGGAFCTIYGIAPIDIVRARVYGSACKNGSTAAAAAYMGSTPLPLRVAQRIWMKEGALAFWAGAGTNFVRYAPHAMLSFWFIDLFKGFASDMLF